MGGSAEDDLLPKEIGFCSIEELLPLSLGVLFVEILYEGQSASFDAVTDRNRGLVAVVFSGCRF